MGIHSGPNADGLTRQSCNLAIWHLSMETTCTECGTKFVIVNEAQLYRMRKTGKVFCTKACGYRNRDKNRKPKLTPPAPRICANCGKLFAATGFKRTYATPSCSKACSSERKSKISSVVMAATNRKYASERMRLKNPMHDEATRSKMASTLREIGHRPLVRGGNGRPPTMPEQMLLEALANEGFVWQFVVPTGKLPGSPYHYKLDLAHPALKVCVEVDGASHLSFARKEQDARKEKFLVGQGWKVFRFTNRQVVTEISSITSKLKDCIHTLRTV